MRFLIVLLLLPQLALGATISGSVFDFGLAEVETAVVTIDTAPEQRVVTQGGPYAFQVVAGTYTLQATATVDGEELSTEEVLTVSEDGEYVLDLILFPDFSTLGEDDFPLDDDFPVLEEPEEPSMLLPIVLILIALVAIVGVAVYYTKLVGAPNDEDDEYREAVLQTLKQHKGRISQRELRKELPFSEAKVSLVLTELQDEDLIKKIKKGRGNVIVLVKKK